MVPGNSSSVKAAEFDAQILSILRIRCAAATTPEEFCEACGSALIRLFGSGNILIVGIETPPTASDPRDDIVSNVVFPKKMTATFPHLGMTTRDILAAGEYWIEHIPSYVGNHRGEFSEYAILVLRAQPQRNAADAVILSHVAMTMAQSLAVIREVAALRQSTRAFSRPKLLSRQIGRAHV